nr:uncharacterized protein LOC124811162 [Hydra vulgaris]
MEKRKLSADSGNESKSTESTNSVETIQTNEILNETAATSEYFDDISDWQENLNIDFIQDAAIKGPNSFKKGSNNYPKNVDNLKFLAEFDPVMEKHLFRAKKKPSSVHYLAKDIQNEIIDLIGKSITFKICSNVQKSVYFSIIVDCIPDISHQEQISMLVRYFDVEDKTKFTWLILQSKCPSLTVKPLSDTRWESHTNAVKTLRYELLPKIYEALQDAAKTANETIAKITAESIALKITSFDFLCSIVIWHKVFEINLTSKQLQAASTNISEALKAMERTINFFKENYKQEKFDSVVCIAQELASFLKVEESFASESASRVRKRKRFFDEPEQN